MDRIKNYLFPVMVLFLLSACGQQITKREAFPNMYQETPVSILVLPTVNQTTAADAKEYYSTTIAEPLSYSGYYVFPIEVTAEILKAEGIYDTELLLSVPPQKFKEYFGADAVLYVTLKKWDTNYFVIGGNVVVGVDFLLRSTRTGEDLWKYDGELVVDTTGDSGGAVGIAGLVVKLAATALKTAGTDYLPVAKRANTITMLSMPYGKYNPNYGQDGNLQILNKNKAKN